MKRTLLFAGFAHLTLRRVADWHRRVTIRFRNLVVIGLGIMSLVQPLFAQRGASAGPVNPSLVSTTTLPTRSDFTKSPYTGYTRQYWLTITEKIIAGFMAYVNPDGGPPDAGMFVLPAHQPGDPAYEKVRWQLPQEMGKRTLERMMMAVVIYGKATGTDEVSGYQGSISAPFLKAIIRGTDPASPGYWGEPGPGDLRRSQLLAERATRAAERTADFLRQRNPQPAPRRPRNRTGPIEIKRQDDQTGGVALRIRFEGEWYTVPVPF